MSQDWLGKPISKQSRLACTSDRRMSEDAESRILLISASLDQACAAVKRMFCGVMIFNLNPLEGGLKYVENPSVIKAFVDDPSDLPTSNIIPWTIKNKYYSADVHFHLVEFSHWNPQSALRVPAVIFVWTRGQVVSSFVSPLISDRC
jgi:hypothetical protein